MANCNVFDEEVNTPQLTFLKAGKKTKKRLKETNVGLLNLASDWTLLADLENKLVFPAFIAVTVLRPDIVIQFLKNR